MSRFRCKNNLNLSRLPKPRSRIGQPWHGNLPTYRENAAISAHYLTRPPNNPLSPKPMGEKFKRGLSPALDTQGCPRQDRVPFPQLGVPKPRSRSDQPWCRKRKPPSTAVLNSTDSVLTQCWLSADIST